jgi:hypothetical protein
MSAAARSRRGSSSARSGHRRDQFARTRHRHGRGRPGYPARVTGLGRTRPAARRARRAPGRRAQHRARLYPKFRGDLLESTVIAQRMRAEIESVRVPQNPLDVLAQQVVAICCDAPSTGRRDLEHLVGRAYPYMQARRRTCCTACWRCSAATTRRRTLPTSSPCWPGTARRTRAEAAPRRRDDGADERRDHTRPRQLHVTLGPDGGRLGELDEEMVFETRPGENILLGATTWRVEEITRDKVIVAPAPGEAGQTAVLARRRSGPADRTRPRARCAGAQARRDEDRPGRRLAAGPGTSRRATRPPTSRTTSTNSRPTPAPCRPTGRSRSSAFATSSATGASASSRRSAPACMRPGRWPCSSACRYCTASMCS